jgi:hypothetical protein
MLIDRGTMMIDAKVPQGVPLQYEITLESVSQFVVERISNSDLRSHLLSRLQQQGKDKYSLMGVLGEVSYWHMLHENGVKLCPSGIREGFPDYKVADANVWLEVAKPYPSNLDRFVRIIEVVRRRCGSIERMRSIQQQELTNILDKKFSIQLNRWHSEPSMSDTLFYLCLDLSCFNAIDMFTRVGGVDVLASLLYGIGNIGVEISRESGKVASSFIENRQNFLKQNLSIINSGYFDRYKLGRLAGVLAIDFHGSFYLYKNPFCEMRDPTFDCAWVKVLEDTTK